MTIEEQIAALHAKAEPLRLLPDEEAEALGLPGLVNQINALRAKQATEAHAEYVAEALSALDQAQAEQAEAEFSQVAGELAPKRRGRPPKNQEAN